MLRHNAFLARAAKSVHATARVRSELQQQLRAFSSRTVQGVELLHLSGHKPCFRGR